MRHHQFHTRFLLRRVFFLFQFISLFSTRLVMRQKKLSYVVCHWLRSSTQQIADITKFSKFLIKKLETPIPVATRSKVCLCGRFFAVIVGSSPSGAWIFVSYECGVLPAIGPCEGLITRSEESCRLWCVVVCDVETLRKGKPWSALGRSARREWENS